MQYVWDETGKQYLDGFAGIVTVSVGNCHPRVVEKVKEQAAKLQHITTLYLHPTIGMFAKKLAEHLPAQSGLSVSYFTNSGSEANEMAVLMSREYTGNHEVISLRNAYHGGTQATMALTAHGTWKFKSNLTVGGAVMPPPEYFQIVYDIVRQHGGLCVADEVQTGFGRTGTKFWGFENWGVTPDLVTMAKGIGNGAPLGACVTRAEIAAVTKNRLHFNTFGGNPISVTQGLATLEVIDRENIQHNAHQVGTHLKNRLLEVQQRQPLIGEVRGMGLMLGVELVRDRHTKEPANTDAAEMLE